MKKLFTLLVIGFVMIAVTGCSPSFDLEEGTYGYTLDLTDPTSPMPVLQEVGLHTSSSQFQSVIFYTLDGSTPAYWDVENATPAQMAALMSLTGSIPYLDLSEAVEPPNPMADFTQYTDVGVKYFMKVLAVPDCMTACGADTVCMAACAPTEDDKTTTVKAVEVNPLLLLLNVPSEVVSAEYTLDTTLWAGDYTVTGNAAVPSPPAPFPVPADAEFQMLVGLLMAPPTGGGFTQIEGDLTITGLTDVTSQLAGLFGGAPYGQLGFVGGLIIEDNPNIGAGSIALMESVLGVTAEHCGNGANTPYLPAPLTDVPDDLCP